MFEPSRIASLELPNRIIRSATHEGLGDADGRPLPELGRVFERLARGGVGALIAGHAAVTPAGRCSPNQRVLHRDEYVDDYRELLAPAKQHGVPIIQQISHGGAGARSPDHELVAPSEVKSSRNGRVARALREDEIEQLVEMYVEAVERTKSAGFDGVQLHCAHGYLLAQFLSPRVNRRADAWGGTTERRFRIVREIVERSRQRVGDFPILAKMNGYSGEPEGLTVEEATSHARRFEMAGADAIEISCGSTAGLFETVRVPRLPVDAMFELISSLRRRSAVRRFLMKQLTPLIIKRARPLHNYNVEAAARIKQAVGIPVIVVGGLRRLEDMEAIVGGDRADYVALSRPLIRTPDLVQRLRTGRTRETSCHDCGYCLIGCVEHPLQCYDGKVR